MLPVPAALKVSTPAASVVAVAGAPSPEIVYVVFGVRSETYCVDAPEAGWVTLRNVAGQFRMNITSDPPTRAPSKFCPAVDSTSTVLLFVNDDPPHSSTVRNWVELGLPPSMSRCEYGSQSLVDGFPLSAVMYAPASDSGAFAGSRLVTNAACLPERGGQLAPVPLMLRAPVVVSHT